MVWISDKQKLAMKIVNELINEFGKDRWFVKSELPTITQHSLDALTSKGYLESKLFDNTNVNYYRLIKQLSE